MDPVQASKAVKSTGAGISAAQLTVTSAGAEGATGACVSTSETVCDTVVDPPHASEIVKVRVVELRTGQPVPGFVLSTNVTVTFPQASETTGVPKLIGIPHSTVKSGKASTDGPFGLVIINQALTEAAFPQGSATVNSTDVLATPSTQVRFGVAGLVVN